MVGDGLQGVERRLTAMAEMLSELFMFLQMTQTGAAFAIAAAAIIALIVSYGLCAAAAGRSFLPDRPNGRSSHRRVTPRSGGLAIMAGWIASAGFLATTAGAPGAASEILKLAGLAAAVALIGFADDRFGLSPLFKFCGQAAAAAGFIALFGALDLAPAPGLGAVTLGAFGVVLTGFWLVAFMNAYNFMDGAHGIAAASAIVVACGLALSAVVAGAGVVAVSALMLAFALNGFLRVNFPDGRLFMGDSGSHSIGFLLAASCVVAANGTDGLVSPLFVPTAMAPFLFDVAFTLAHRLYRRRNVLHAHREHVYQLLLRHGASHVRVTALYTGLTAASTAAALLMLGLAPKWQFIVPAALALVLAPPAYSVFRRSAEAGFFDEACAGEDAAAPTFANPVDPIAQAAE